MIKFKQSILMLALILIVNCMTYNVVLEDPVRLEVSGEFIDIPSPTYAGPLISDYDQDGLDDLIVGTFRGHFRLYRNTGSKSEPLYTDFSLIQAEGKDARAQNW